MYITHIFAKGWATLLTNATRIRHFFSSFNSLHIFTFLNRTRNTFKYTKMYIILPCRPELLEKAFVSPVSEIGRSGDAEETSHR